VGFFAAKCVRHSKVPVLLARREAVGPFEKVVACIDFSETTNEVLDAALRVAADEGARLDIVHAVRPPWQKATHVLFDLTTAEDDDFKAQFREVLAGEMAGAVKGIADAVGVEVETHIIEHPNPEEALINFLRENGSDLAVVGRSGHTVKVLKHYLIGTTAERLIHRAPCSVLTVSDTD
jgi:nucleotide-binding universal stress UspA family protein